MRINDFLLLDGLALLLDYLKFTVILYLYGNKFFLICCVIAFTVVNIGKCNFTKGAFPAFIRVDVFLDIVTIYDLDFTNQSGINVGKLFSCS